MNDETNNAVSRQSPDSPKADTIFPSTMWSQVMEAADSSSAQARIAFAGICASYRDAIVRWMSLQHLTAEDAEDAAHDFLEQWLRRGNPLQGFTKGERRFREFLRVCLRRFLSDWRKRRQTKSRGGEFTHVTWEHDELIEETIDSVPLIDLELARNVHENALKRLARDWQAQIPGNGYQRLRVVALGEEPNPGYDSLGQELGVPVGTVKSWVFRLRREYYDAFRFAVSQQADPSLIDVELQYFQELLRRIPPWKEQGPTNDMQPPPPDSR
ncbi:MAG: hypothetical protein L0Z50_36855 [Verrucomicrobiales bacterium]|nr:hypothetical protein [Verrucomicrobiales bacterium]